MDYSDLNDSDIKELLNKHINNIIFISEKNIIPNNKEPHNCKLKKIKTIARDLKKSIDEINNSDLS